MDMDGNTMIDDSQGMEDQTVKPNPLDFVQVKNKRSFKHQRKEMSESLTEKVDKEVNDFIKEKKEEPNLKIKPKKEMSKEKRE